MSFTLPQPVKITHIENDNYRTKTLELDCTLDAYPGQFAMIWLPRFDEKPFSLVQADPVRIMVTAVGPFSHLVHEKAVGETLWIRGPFGNGFTTGSVRKRIALVGGGYGVAPLYWLAQHATGTAETIHAILGARQAEDVLYVNRFEALRSTAHTDHHLHITTEDGTLGTMGRVTDRLEPMLAAHQIDAIYACGPDGMLAALEGLAKQYEIAAQLSWEAYMRCAIGICGACDHHGKVLCMDGPVLSVV